MWQLGPPKVRGSVQAIYEGEKGTVPVQAPRTVNCQTSGETQRRRKEQETAEDRGPLSGKVEAIVAATLCAVAIAAGEVEATTHNFEADKVVMIQGLQRSTHLNGRMAKVISWSPERPKGLQLIVSRDPSKQEDIQMVNIDPRNTRPHPLMDPVVFYPRDWHKRPPHERLGLPPHATPDQVKGAYRRISVHLHPDKNGRYTDEAVKFFQALGNARDELLTTEPKREVPQQTRQDQFKGTPFGQQPRPRANNIRVQVSGRTGQTIRTSHKHTRTIEGKSRSQSLSNFRRRTQTLT